MRLNENFSISTPHALKTITEKPNLVNPHSQVDPAMSETARLKLNDISQLKDTNLVSRGWNKGFFTPNVASQDIGAESASAGGRMGRPLFTPPSLVLPVLTAGARPAL